MESGNRIAGASTTEEKARPKASQDNRSDKFSVPPDSEGEFVRRTYAHFAVAGVPNDGYTEGKEYTRERHGLSAWEEASLSRSSTSAYRRKDSPANSPMIGSSSAPNVKEISTTHAQPSDTLGVSASALTASASSKSAISSDTVLSTNEWQTRQVAAETVRKDILSSIDRYGFFADSNSNGYHKSLLFSARTFDDSFPKKGATGMVGLSTPTPIDLASDVAEKEGRHARSETVASNLTPDTVAEARAGFIELHRRKEKDRIVKWSKMLSVQSRDSGHNVASYAFANGLSPKRLRRRVYKGVPDIWRSAVWSALLEQRNTVVAKTQSTETVSAEKFESLTLSPSPYDVQIDLDVPRTISGHVQFHTRYGQGQRDLFHVLHDISLLCPDCGYCQGMGPIAATFLCYLPPEQAYGIMVAAHQRLGLHDTFRPGFPGMVENLYVQEQLVKTYMPELYTVLRDQSVSTSAYATKWYITMFSNTVPFETQLRIWDAWLLDGQDVIVMTALAVLWALRATTLDPRADFETILGGLSGYFVPENDDSFMHWIEEALKRKDVGRSIKLFRAQYNRQTENGENIDII